MDLFPDIFAAKRLPIRTADAVDIARAITNLPYGGVGTHVIAHITVASNTTILPGTTFAGSSLGYANGTNIVLNMHHANTAGLVGIPSIAFISVVSLELSGTWRLLTRIHNSSTTRQIPGLFVRIA